MAYGANLETDEKEAAVRRTIQYPIALVIMMSLILALTACVRPAPGSEGVDIAATATAAALATIPPLPTQPEGLVLPATITPFPIEQPTVTPEPQPVAPEPTAASAVALPTTHVVQSGETLFTISALYGVPVNELQQANNVADPNILAVGQTLTIPVPGTVVQPPTTGGGVYIVQPGDNLFRIGLNNGYTAAELAAYNNIPDMTRIYPGQEIRFPPR